MQCFWDSQIAPLLVPAVGDFRGYIHLLCTVCAYWTENYNIIAIMMLSTKIIPETAETTLKQENLS